MNLSAIPVHGSGKRVVEIDGLRGIAAIGVAYYHIHPQGTFWMWSFVDLFFVLSGFLITGILLRLEHWDAVSVRNFWMRRILRIWPVYYLTLFGVLMLWFVWQQRHGQPLSGFSGFWESLVYLQYLVGDYATLPPGTNYLWWFGHSWSLAVEEQFYLLWPLLLWAFRHRPAWCAMALAVFAALVYWVRLESDLPNYLLFTRGDGLAMGSLIAVLTQSAARDAFPAPLVRAGKWLPYVTALAAAIALFPYFHAGYGGGPAIDAAAQEQLPFLFAVAYASIVCIVLGGLLKPLNRLLRLSPLVYLGGLSYAIYMFHLPVQKLLDQFYNAGQIGSRWIVELVFWVAVIGCAALSRVWIEDRAERLKSRFPLRFKRTQADAAERPVEGAAAEAAK